MIAEPGAAPDRRHLAVSHDVELLQRPRLVRLVVQRWRMIRHALTCMHPCRLLGRCDRLQQ
jgi:hypothetical protein